MLSAETEDKVFLSAALRFRFAVNNPDAVAIAPATVPSC